MVYNAWAPGRVNLIGEHTDYTGGLVFPMAIQLGVTLQFEPREDVIELSSLTEDGVVSLSLPVADAEIGDVVPRWGRYVAAVAAGVRSRLGETHGFAGMLSSTLPAGAGLSSSAALEVAVAMALGAGDSLSSVEVAQLAQGAEFAATGVPCGIMDQLASTAGVAGHALRIDCATLSVEPVPLGPEARVVVIHSGETRQLETSAYAERRAQCEDAESIVGLLRLASLDDLSGITDPVTRHRARHVISENQRVEAFGAALVAGELVAAGEQMVASHASMRYDFEITTPRIDSLVAHLNALDGIFGARMTGGGFGGCVVALCRPDIDPIPAGYQGWIVEPSGGARVTAN